MKLPLGVIECKTIVWYYGKTHKWCRSPYPGHPRGCPKYGKKGCPPKVPFLSEVLDLERPLYLAFSRFSLQKHVRKLKRKHPDWSRRQLRCVLYWQGTSRKQMRERARECQRETGADVVLDCPEALGVNVYVTCALNGLKLEKIKNLKVCRHVALVGFRRRL